MNIMSDPRRVFITGTSAGFGYEATKALAERGHTVYATMRGVAGKNSSKAHALESWANGGGHSVHILDVDVTDETAVGKAVAAAVELGGIDVLINNAGVGMWGIDAGFSTEQAQQIFDTNLFGMMRVNRAVVPHFSEAGKGLIVYVSSALGRIVFPFLAIYAASKFAVEGFCGERELRAGATRHRERDRAAWWLRHDVSRELGATPERCGEHVQLDRKDV